MRRYSEEEVKAILRMAAAEREGADDGQGLTLDELVKVAGEVGVSEDRVRDAAMAWDTDPSAKQGPGLLGFRTYTEVHRTVEGEVTHENTDEVVAALRSAFKGPMGETSQLGKTTEWSSATEFRGLQVSLTPSNGRTLVRARLSAWGAPWFAYVFGGTMGSMLTLAFIKKWLGAQLQSEALSVIAFFAIVLGILALVRFWVAGWYARTVTNMNEALDRTEHVLGRHEGLQTDSQRTQAEDDVRLRLGPGDPTP